MSLEGIVPKDWSGIPPRTNFPPPELSDDQIIADLQHRTRVSRYAAAIDDPPVTSWAYSPESNSFEPTPAPQSPGLNHPALTGAAAICRIAATRPM
jgi:hypothetical protein